MTERSDRACRNCQHCVIRDGEPRCWIDPPEATLIGMKSPALQGAPPVPVVIAVQRPTFPWYRCARWEERTAEHPDYDLVPDATHAAPEVRQ
jgi:hypothetical protein